MQKRASGELLTTAAWLRQFVQTHPLYKQDSVVSEEVFRITYQIRFTKNVTFILVHFSQNQKRFGCIVAAVL